MKREKASFSTGPTNDIFNFLSISRKLRIVRKNDTKRLSLRLRIRSSVWPIQYRNQNVHYNVQLFDLIQYASDWMLLMNTAKSVIILLFKILQKLSIIKTEKTSLPSRDQAQFS